MTRSLNFRGALALMKITWQSWIAQRSFFFLLAFGWMMGPLIYLFVWRAAAEGGTAGTFTPNTITLYYLVLIAVNQFTMTQANWIMGDSIRYGYLNEQLLRPFPPLMDSVMNELAGKGVFMLFTLPVALILALILRPEVEITAGQVLAFVPALILGWLLRFTWGLWLALLAFWATRADALLALQDALLFLFAGQVAPMELLPGWLRGLAEILPFRYMIGFPVEALTRQMSAGELAAGFAMQIAWLVPSTVLVGIVWRAGLRRYESAERGR
jgi:ABC-2 type transport system permease protein